MSAVQPRPRLDPAAYLEWESRQSERHELVDGEVYAMTGARDRHNRVAGNLYVALRNALRGTPCRTFMSDMKLHVETARSYLYPDIFVTCDARDRLPEADLAKRHPLLVVEVMSESTAADDRGRKFGLYRALPTLREVVFVDPEDPGVELFRRNDAGQWVLHPYAEGESMRLESLALDLPLSAIYEDVEPPAAP